MIFLNKAKILFIVLLPGRKRFFAMGAITKALLKQTLSKAKVAQDPENRALLPLKIGSFIKEKLNFFSK